MAYVSTPPAPVNPAPRRQRTLRVIDSRPAWVRFAVRDERGEVAYYEGSLLSADDFGTDVRVEKDGGESYTVSVGVGAPAAGRCTCKGHTYRPNGTPCRHVAAVRKLQELGHLTAADAQADDAERHNVADLAGGEEW